MTWLTWLVFSVVLLVLVLVALKAWGALRWRQATRQQLARMASTQQPATAARYDPAELAGLPAPVQRYFRAVLTPGQAMVSAVSIEHTGRMNLSAGQPQWKPFTSRQRVLVHRPAFLWDARVALFPGLSVRVHDSYAAGQGLLHAAVLGLVKVARLQGGGVMAEAELMRFLAEAAWYPTALLPSQGVRWAAVDEHSARATLVDGPLSLSLLFSFDAQGLMAAVRAESRSRMVGSQVSAAPWEGRWSQQQRVDGMTVPFSGEVAWVLPEGVQTYWRGTITSLRYEWAPA